MKQSIDRYRALPPTAKKRLGIIAGIYVVGSAGIVAGVATSSEEIKPTKALNTPTTRSIPLLRTNAVNKYGPLLFDPPVSRGVNCERGTQNFVVGSPIYTRHDVLKVPTTPDINYDYDSYDPNAQIEGYVGLDKGVAASYGYYPIINGWALRRKAYAQNFELYNFTVGSYKTEKRPHNDGPTTGVAYGEQVASFNVASLAILGSSDWTDGTTTVSVSLDKDWSAPEQYVDMDIQCAEYIAPHPIKG